MASLGDIFVNLRANTAAFIGPMRRAQGQTSAMSGTLKRLAVQMAAGFGLIQAGRWLVNVNREYERLNAQLITVTGSQKEATRAFQALEQFAKETPFQIEENVQAFVKLRALGIQPTNEMMTDFGNIASGMGRRITDFARAVQGAVTGETEALKAFGIVSRIQGEQMSFTFNGVTRTVKRSSAEIVEALQEISQESFAGAMANEMDTLNGILSNLQDNMGILARSIGVVMLPILKGMAGKIRDVAGAIAENKGAVRAWAGVVFEAGKVFFEFGRLIVATAWDILTTAGKVLGDFGALVVGIFTLDFQLVKTAWTEIKNDLIGGLTEIQTNTQRFAAAYVSLMEASARAWQELGKTADEGGDSMAAQFEKFGEGATAAAKDMDTLIDRARALAEALTNLVKNFRFNVLGGLVGGLFGFLGGGPVGGGLGFASGAFGLPNMTPQDFRPQTVSAPTAQIVMSPATNSLAAARDADWLGLIAETNRALGANGYRFEVVG